MTAGYEYSPGSDSNIGPGRQFFASVDTPTFSGVRPFGVWL